MLKSKGSEMRIIVQRQTHSESTLPNVATNSRANTFCGTEGSRQKYAALSQRHPDRTLTCSNVTSSLVGDLTQKLRALEVENRRLMTNQGQLVAEANRRVEMHINEVRVLKEELKELNKCNKELRDLCCFLDDDRQKTRRLSREWQKFGRYTSEVMKQEVKAYQAKLRELEERQQLFINENDELKRLCLYLDEQRQMLQLSKTFGDSRSNNTDANCRTKSVDGSIGCDSSGCGSSADSQRGSEDEAEENVCNQDRLVAGYDDKQENTLRMITQQMQTSLTLERCSNTAEKTTSGCSDERQDRLFQYIQSLETRIRQLELSTQYNNEVQWLPVGKLNFSRERSNEFASQKASDVFSVDTTDPETTHASEQTAANTNGMNSSVKKDMLESTCTVTSSGTTYCSTDADSSVETAVFVTGDEVDCGLSRLEVRTLGPIDEEKEDSDGTRDELLPSEVSRGDAFPGSSTSNLVVSMPPAIAPVSACVSRLSSYCSDLSLDGMSLQTPQPLATQILKNTERSSSLVDLSRNNSVNATNYSRSDNVSDSLAEAVKVLRVHEMAARKNMRGLTAQETAMVQHMCQIAWDSLDRKSQSLGNNHAEPINDLKAQMTAV